jgi:hypothetical protein
MRLSDDDIARLVGDLGSLPQPLRTHVQELIDNPEAFKRRAAAVEIAVSFYSATLLAVLDKDLDNITRLTEPLRSLDGPTRLAVGEALEWWSCSDERTRSDYLERQHVVVHQIAHPIDRPPPSYKRYERTVPTWEEFIPEVAQAQGMVSVQANCTLAQALAMMHERAQIQHQTLNQVAEGVLARSIRFGL